MNFETINKELMSFIDKSYSAFHAVKELATILEENGFTKLLESEKWTLNDGGKYYVTRNQSSIIAFTVPKKDFTGFNMVASHSDSPTFKLKQNNQIKVEGNYTKLNTEPLGGLIASTWCDRVLSVAGRVLINTENGIESKLVNIDKDLLIIPNVAIHMQRDHNDGRKINPQVDMLPLLGDETADIMDIISKEICVEKENIISHDLFLYPRIQAKIIGANGEFINCPKLDDLQCAFTSIKAITQSENKQSVNLAAVFDNEEVGSSTKQGAGSTFLFDTLTRICLVVGKSTEDYKIAISNSFMVSADNAHAVHPNAPEKTDQTNRNYINKGPVIKHSANQKYTTDAVSSAIFKKLCKIADVPYQEFHNRSDMPGGSTLGNISNTKVSLNTVDIGLPQFAMHSAVETAGTKDTAYTVEALKVLYTTEFIATDFGIEMKGTN
ncbi:MAG: M18 family aminopeptidase [Clostridia bacterium]